MPTGLKVVVAVNLLASVLIFLFASIVGGGFAPGEFFSSPSIELELVPIPRSAEPVAKRVAPPSPGFTRIEIPQAYRGTDLSSAPWEVLPDGRVRMNGWK